jgi:hypothetical protein
LRMLEKRVPRIILGHMREQVTEGWRKLHNEEFHFTLHHISLQWANQVGWVACNMHGEMRNVYRIIVGNLKRRDHLGCGLDLADLQ